MNLLPCSIPLPPYWRLDWQSLHNQFGWIQAMKGCPQSPVFHQEGDVSTHVRMVCECLVGLREWRELPERDRELLFAAALLHDVAKPDCTRVEDNRITSRGHSQRGAIQARRILWEYGADFSAREHLCALVRYHQSPFHLIDRIDAHRMIRMISQTTRCDFLAILAKADALGRRCLDQTDLLAQIGLFRELCHDLDCMTSPASFPSTLSRFEYFRANDRDPSFKAHDHSACEVILMSGLPGAGKDSWITGEAAPLPHISLDAIRMELDVGPTGDQGVVVQEAREQARKLLRTRQSFVWNATNLSRQLRNQLIDLLTNYQARVRIVYVETPAHQLWKQNRERSATVPKIAIERMMQHWEVPGPTEAVKVEWWENLEVWTPRLLLDQ